MATKEEVFQQAKALKGARRAAWSEFTALVRHIDFSDAARASKELQALLPIIVAKYGDVVNLLAAEFFEAMIGNQAVFADHMPDDELQGTVRWAMDGAFGANPNIDAVKSTVFTTVVDRSMTRSYKETIRLSAAKYNVKFARVPTGDSCQFCIMLASQGPVYNSDKTAGTDPHDGCSCIPTPIRTIEDFPEHYDPDALYDEYVKNQETAAQRKALKEAQANA